MAKNSLATKVPPLPARWASSVPAIKAVQVAFDVSESVMEAVRKAAFDNSLSTSDQLREILGLVIVRQAKRPRLTISLSAEDYQVLGKRFGLKAQDYLAIKERVMLELVDFAQAGQKPAKRTNSAKRDRQTTSKGKL
jgi:hypothetical protein